ncbi:EF-hand domain-containing protein [Bremerella sp. T1]|uniref:EF-hand domain-containing protein n=1 Tax=Bremerella sp. TYQ1 TaxID=3119568 RepID=UPI001CCAA4CD|nr:EF-hand domain-containing protein [Bremerella volcania]UBM34472.1 EF-hand domain-containing protein [Bremerella volcania]
MKNVWKTSLVMLSLMFVGVAMTSANAQDRERGPRGPRDGERREGDRGPREFNPEQMIERLMNAMDKDDDGKITKEEAGEGRGAAMIERADADKDGVVTKEELTKAFSRRGGDRPGPQRDGERGNRGPRDGDRPEMRRGEGDRPGPPRDGERGPRGPRDGERREGDRGPRDGDRPGPRPEGRPEFGAMMGPGMMPGFVMERLELSEEQRREVRALQEEMQKKFMSILTEEQRETMKEMRERRPGGDRPEGRPQFRGPRDGDRPEGPRGPRGGERGPRGGDRERGEKDNDDA